MRLVVWIAEGTWPACVDAAARLAPADAHIMLLHVTAEELPAAAHGAFAGPLGRGGQPDLDPGGQVDEVAAETAQQLLGAAARRLDRPAALVARRGRTGHEVVSAAGNADLLVLARDGERGRGPRSLSPAARFVVDHAPCAVLLVWPRPAPPGTPPPPDGPP